MGLRSVLCFLVGLVSCKPIVKVLQERLNTLKGFGRAEHLRVGDGTCERKRATSALRKTGQGGILRGWLTLPLFEVRVSSKTSEIFLYPVG